MAYDPKGGDAVAILTIESTDLVENGGDYVVQRGPYLVLYAPGGLGGAISIGDLVDVTLASLLSGDILHYNGANWENKPAEAYAFIKNKLDATVDPTVNEDSGDGYSVGSRWINVTDDKEFVCLDAGVGTAVWIETTGAGADEKAGVSANDTTPDYLVTKVVAGSNITVTETNDGGNETLVIAATGSLTNDSIAEGDSSVEVIDAGTGVINITVDGTLIAVIDINGLDLQDKLLEKPELLNYRESAVVTNVTTTYTIDLTNGNNFRLTLTGDTTLTFPSGLTTGKTYSFTIRAIQSSGGHSFTWPAAAKWPGGTPPTQTTTAGAIDLYQFMTDDGGTTWFASQAGADYS